MAKKIKSHELVELICQYHINLVDGYRGCGEYTDTFSLYQAIEIASTKLPQEVSKEDVEGWRNPYLDYIAEEYF